jgi:hypothetical protein
MLVVVYVFPNRTPGWYLFERQLSEIRMTLAELQSCVTSDHAGVSLTCHHIEDRTREPRCISNQGEITQVMMTDRHNLGSSGT